MKNQINSGEIRKMSKKEIIAVVIMTVLMFITLAITIEEILDRKSKGTSELHTK